jgi:hypothetical protein
MDIQTNSERDRQSDKGAKGQTDKLSKRKEGKETARQTKG